MPWRAEAIMKQRSPTSQVTHPGAGSDMSWRAACYAGS